MDGEMFSAKQKLERNGSANDQLPEQDRSTDLFGAAIGNGKDAKQLEKPKPRRSVKPRFLSGQ